VKEDEVEQYGVPRLIEIMLEMVQAKS
jgi:A/G-specific adenine glycosylase